MEHDSELVDAIMEAWRAIPESFLETLIESMESRVIWVSENQGGHSRY